MPVLTDRQQRDLALARAQVGGAGVKQSRFFPDRQTGLPHFISRAIGAEGHQR